MLEFVKPLLSFRKYWIAHKILKTVANPTIWYCDSRGGYDPNNIIHKITFPRIYYNDLIKFFIPKADPVKTLMIIDLLEKNEQIEKIQIESFKDFGIFCTKKGFQDFADGYYIKRIYRFFFAVIGTPVSIIGIIKLIEMLL